MSLIKILLAWIVLIVCFYFITGVLGWVLGSLLALIFNLELILTERTWRDFIEIYPFVVTGLICIEIVYFIIKKRIIPR